MDDQNLDKYLYFSSQELMAYFRNNVKEKDIKTQCRRIFEMARVFMAKKDFGFEDLYSIAVMVRDIQDASKVNEIFRLYFKHDRYPVRVMIQIEELEDVSDIEMEFSAFQEEKEFINAIPEDIADIPASQAVVIENYVHTSSIGPRQIGDIENQVRQCIEKVQAVLTKSGSSLEQVYSIMVYLKDLSLLPRIEKIFAEYDFIEQDISKQVIQVLQLCQDYDVEISCSGNLNQ